VLCAACGTWLAWLLYAMGVRTWLLLVVIGLLGALVGLLAFTICASSGGKSG